MPLVHSEMIGETSTLLLWKLTETEAELRDMLGSGYITEELNAITHPQKIREWLASRLLIKTLAEQFEVRLATLTGCHEKGIRVDVVEQEGGDWSNAGWRLV